MMLPSCWPGSTLEKGGAAPYHHEFGIMSRNKLLTDWHLRFTLTVTSVLKVVIREEARAAPLCERSCSRGFFTRASFGEGEFGGITTGTGGRS